jgi:hypothetical protein
MPLKGLGGAALIGELGLDGQVRPVRGNLPMALAATKAGIGRRPAHMTEPGGGDPRTFGAAGAWSGMAGVDR